MTAIRNLRSKRVAVALISATAVGVLGVGGALAAGTSDDGPVGPSPVPGETQPAGSSGSDGGSDGGTVSGSGGGTGGPEPSTSPSGPPHTGGPDPSPTGSADLAEVARRIDELEKKVDQLPTKKELADALRAFADSLEQQG
ncbi:hypothetical protein [Streptomyces microflavus]|uniref:hypothetical protein n=1 Tax=Streptomyces microflavus TaxID=1919 RepID=UPI0036EB9F19